MSSLPIPTPPSGLKTTAIALLFKDGFSIENLVEVFSLSPDNIEEHVRRAMFNGNGHRPPIQEAPAAEPKKVKARKAGNALPISPPSKPAAKQDRPAAAGNKGCEKHPDSEVDKRGRCRQCSRDYQAEHWKKKQAEKAAAGKTVRKYRPRQLPELPIEESFDADDEDDDAKETPVTTPSAKPDTDFVYSKPFKCPKCGETGRLRRRAEADPDKDYWLHIHPNGGAPCMLKMANYQIKDAPGYRPEAGI